MGSVAGSGDFDLKVYPNPVRDVLQVEISGTIKGKATLSLFDLSGKLVRETGLDGQKAEIRMGDLARGTYILKYHDEEGSGTMRVQKL